MTQTNNKRRKDEARARVAAARAAQLKAARARRLRTYLGATVAVLVVVAAVVIGGVVASHHNKASKASIASATPVPASAALVAKVTGVSAETLASVGTGNGQTLPLKHVGDATGPILKINGKPAFAYVGGEYCPYCAATRWAIVQALSRFGTFTDLYTTHSASNDAQPNTPTFTFLHVGYSSPYLTFSHDELAGTVNNGTVLQQPTKQQSSEFTTYDPGGYFPFFSIGNRYVDVGSLQNSTAMANKTLDEIADQLNNPKNQITQSILADANQMAAGICAIDGGEPASVCTSAAVVAGQSLLTSGAKFNASLYKR